MGEIEVSGFDFWPISPSETTSGWVFKLARFNTCVFSCGAVFLSAVPLCVLLLPVVAFEVT